jgi:hypothetical protein
MTTSWKKQISIAFGVYSAILIGAIVIYLVVNRAMVGEDDVEFTRSLLTVTSFSFLATFLAYGCPDHKKSWLLLAVALPQQTRILSKIVKIVLVGGAGERRSFP